MIGVKNLIKKDWIPIFALFIFLPLFTYNLTGHSLVDFDEAWYGSIASNIIKNKNPIKLEFNGSAYYDHPPLGFNIMALSILVFGQNEFGARLPSAICAILSLVLIYLIGKNLFGKDVGLASALILLSCVWFVYRARTADLDSILLFFYLFTFYSAIRATRNPRWIAVLGMSFYATLLTKSVIGLTLILPILALFWAQKASYPLKSIIEQLLVVVLIGLCIVGMFMVAYQYQSMPFNQYLATGLKAGNLQKINFFNIFGSQTMQYLHFGMGKWYYLAAFSFFGSILLVAKNKVLVSIYAWIIVLLCGYLTNAKTEIWHLIPLYIPLGLLIAYFSQQVSHFLCKLTKGIHKNSKQLYVVMQVIYLSFFAFVALYQLAIYKNQIRLFGEQVDPVAYLSSYAKNMRQALYLDSQTYVPAVAAFYSHKNVTVFRNRQKNNTLATLLNDEKGEFLLITEKWKLDLDKIPTSKYKIINQKDGHVLVEANK